MTTLARVISAAWPALLALVLAVIMTWPLSRHLGDSVGGDIGDPLFFVWQVAWIGHAVLHQPLELFQANIYWPLEDSLAFTDTLVGFAPAGVFSSAGPVAVYNVLFLLSYALAFLGAFLLARELGAGDLGGMCAGVAFAYAPWRLAHNAHLSLLATGGIPLALFLLVRGYRRRSGRYVLAGWLVAAWQMTLAFALGLQFAYLLLVLAALGAAFAWHSRHTWLTRGVVLATVAGAGVFVLATVLHARPYFRVVDSHPESARTTSYVASLSPTPRSFIAAPEQSFLWGDVTARAREPFQRAPNEQVLFPGLAITLLALAGLVVPVYPRRLRIGLGAGTALTAVLSLGLRESDGLVGYLWPYRLLYELAPGWDAVRTPGRIVMLTSLGLALLAAAGLAGIVAALGRASPWRRAAALAVPLVLLTAILLEGLGPLRVERVPPQPAGHEAWVAPRLHLPPDNPSYVVRYILWSADDFGELVNGAGSFEPAENVRLLEAMEGFPDAVSVSRLRALGVRSVVLHRDLAERTRWARVAEQSVDGLPVVREVVGDAVLFRLAGLR